MKQRKINVVITTVLAAAGVSSLFIVSGKDLIAKYNITFDSQDGTNVDSIVGVTGSLVSAPANPTKEGYTFTGWVDENNKPFSFDTMPGKDTTITATWKINQYTISFDSKGGSSVSSITQDYGSTINPPASPTFTGYTFNYWFLDGETKPYTFSTMPAKNITLSADWTINRHNVKFIVDGEEYRTDRYNFNESIVLPTLTKTGYTYDLWYTDSTFITKISAATMQNQDITLYGRSLINSYDVTYHIPGKEDKVQSYEYNSTVDLTFDFNQGYTFNGWFTTQDYSGSKLSNYKMPANNINLYGKYIPNTYSMTFISDGNTYKTIEKSYKETIGTVVDPIKVGYTFDYWYTNDINTQVDIPTTMPLGGLTLTAKYTIHSHALNYYVDGEIAYTQNLDYNETLDALYTPNYQVGKTFVGWYKEDGLLNETTSITMVDEDINLYAKFTDNKYIVKFLNYNNTEISTINDVAYGSTVTFTGSTPTKPSDTGNDYTFSGWDEDITSPIFGNTTFIAQFNSSIRQYTMNFVVDGTTYKTIINDYQSPIVDPTTPTKTGYTFAYWYLGDDDSIAATLPVTMPGENRTYTAKWNANKHSVTYIGDTTTTLENVEYGTSINLDPLTKTGYTFDGWYKEAAYTNKVTSMTMPDNNITLYAKFTINSHSLIYKYKDINGTLQTIETTNLNYNASIDLTEKSVTGYSFKGWYTDEALTQNVTTMNMPDLNTILYGKYVKQYTVTFNNGTETLATETVDSGELATYTGATPSKASTTELVYTFDGWDKDLNTLQITADTVFTAKFSSSVRKYTITFANANNGENVTKDVPYGTLPTYDGVPTKANSGATTYTFTGWDKTIVNVAGEETYTAQFSESEDKSYGLRYIAIDADTCYVYSFDKSHTNVVIPSMFDVDYDGDKETVVSLGKEGISGSPIFSNSSVTSVSLPNTIKYISDWTFGNTTSLTTLQLPDNLEYVGDKAFYGTGIKSLEFKKKLQFIGKYVFDNSSIETLTFEDGALASSSGISEYAFYYTNHLTKVVLPNTFACLSDRIFGSCKALTSIIIPAITDINNTDGYQGSYFSSCSALTHIYIESTTYTSTQITNLLYNSNSITKLYYYSATEKTDGNYWHYDTLTGLPVVWGA